MPTIPLDGPATYVSQLQNTLQFMVNVAILVAAMAFVYQKLPVRVSTLRDSSISLLNTYRRMTGC
jgi:hypothetical protein